MKCKKHPSDLSSTVGVCASCLSERLILLMAAQAQAQAQAHPQVQFTRASDQFSRNSEPNLPPPLIFPRSVSPYVSRRKSDYSDHRLFYSTPQLRPTFCSADSYNADASSLKKRFNRFRIFSNLFRSRSEKLHSDPPCEASPSWLSAFFPSRRRNKDRTGEDSAAPRRRYRPSDRGMSPVRTEDLGEEYDQSPSASGYASEASQWWQRTPTVARRTKLGHAKSALGSGIALSLSPLVRARPNRRWNYKGFPAEMAEVRVAAEAAKPNLSAAASFNKNRSRKLADFGRVNHHR
ncbi:hypothetical protein Fmac_017721 [Flemingia macrophylla]|uniref:Uncharacterized protein n=1 Tax=Flemingia macrophylla TaxID=520843 RepID=A0ABD1M4S4_9FABA